MSADARPARNTTTTDAAEIIDPNTLRPFIQPPSRGVGAMVPVRFATALATHFGVVADAENLLSGGRETFGGKKRVRAESEKKNNNNKGRLPGNANENPMRFMPHVTSKPREKIKTTTQLHLFLLLFYFFANPTKIRRRGLVRRYFPRRKLRSSYLRTHRFELRKTRVSQNNNTICGFCGNLHVSLVTCFSHRIICIIQELSRILKIR